MEQSVGRTDRNYIELAAIGVGILLSAARRDYHREYDKTRTVGQTGGDRNLRSIGATRTFIRIPYFLEGAVLGGCGSALSLGFSSSRLTGFGSRFNCGPVSAGSKHDLFLSPLGVSRRS